MPYYREDRWNMSEETIAHHYGLKDRLCMLMEECGELVQAANKVNRMLDSCEPNQLQYAPNDIYNTIVVQDLAEEIADVKILIGEVIFLLGCETEKDVSNFIDYKYTRALVNIVNGRDKVNPVNLERKDYHDDGRQQKDLM